MPTPGTVLAAAEALRTRRDGVWTDEQVSCLLMLAFDSGRTATALDDVAEMHATWAEHPNPRQTRAERIAERVAEMETHAARLAADMGRPGYDYQGGPVEWTTGRPARQLETV